jgi:hypothetical protein
LDLCSGRGGERDIGQSVAKRRVACLVEGGEPAVEEAAGGGAESGDAARMGRGLEVEDLQRAMIFRCEQEAFADIVDSEVVESPV